MNETTQVYGEVVMSEMATPAFMQSMQQQMMMPKEMCIRDSLFPYRNDGGRYELQTANFERLL